MGSHLLSTSSFSFLFLLLLVIGSVSGAATNRTIDDTVGDSVTGTRPVYSPSSGVWEDATCKGCYIQPDPLKAFDGTWSAATYNPKIANMTVQFSFEGTALYVYFILANTIADTTTITECNFTLDGVSAGSFTHTPTTSTELQYNALVFSKTGLTNANHTFVISTSGLDHNVFVNFDYAQYTFQEIVTSTTASASTKSTPTSSSSSTASATGTKDPSTLSSSSSSTPVGAIAGGVVGGLLFLAALVGLLFCCRRRRRQRQHHTIPSSDESDGPIPMTEANAPRVVPYPAYPSNTQNSAVAPSIYADSSSQFFEPTQQSLRHNDDLSRSEFNTAALTAASTTNQDWDQTTAPTSASVYSPQTHTTSGPYRGNSVHYTNHLSSLPSGATRLTAAHARLPSSSYADSTADSDTNTSFAAQSIPSIPPIPPTSGSRAPSNAELRRERQMELERQMRAINQEMRNLTTEAAGRRASLSAAYRGDRKVAPRENASVNASQVGDAELGGGEGGVDVQAEEDFEAMKEQIRMMKEQIMMLQSQQESPWAQGLSDEPPPGYTPEAVAH